MKIASKIILLSILLISIITISGCLQTQFLQPQSIVAPSGNIITNPEFKSGTTGWVLGTGTYYVCDNKAIAVTGDCSQIKMNTTSASLTQPLSLQPSTVYTLTMYVRDWDWSPDFISVNLGGTIKQIPTIYGDYKLHTTQITTPSVLTTNVIKFYVPTDTLFFDNIYLVKGESIPIPPTPTVPVPTPTMTTPTPTVPTPTMTTPTPTVPSQLDDLFGNFITWILSLLGFK